MRRTSEPRLPGRPGRTSRRSGRPSRFVLAGVALLFLLLLLSFFLSPGERPPRHPDDLCAIFEEKRDWYQSARQSFETWGVPESVQLAVIYHESGFQARARPPREWFLWIFPGRRKSSAYGYAQVLDSTWEAYREATGRTTAVRDELTDVTFFVGWYGDEIHRRTGIAKTDAYHLYLAYHEGPGGYRRGTHLAKPWLLEVSRKVASRAATYERQYAACEERLRSSRSWLVWLVLIVLVAAWAAWRRRRR